MLQESIDAQRNVYQPVAAVGSRLYFTLLDLQKLNPMYRFALPMFLDLYAQALDSKELAHANPQERTTSLGPLLERLVFGAVSRALLKRDRLTYAMYLVHMLHPELFGDREWSVFTGAATGEESGAAWAAQFVESLRLGRAQSGRVHLRVGQVWLRRRRGADRVRLHRKLLDLGRLRRAQGGRVHLRVGRLWLRRQRGADRVRLHRNLLDLRRLRRAQGGRVHLRVGAL